MVRMYKIMELIYRITLNIIGNIKAMKDMIQFIFKASTIYIDLIVY